MQRRSLQEGFFLAGLHVEPSTGKVEGPDAQLHLSPEATDLLLCLASEPQTLLSREQLINEVWQDGDGNSQRLSEAAREIRQVFGDDQTNPTLIQSLPKRGYRLLAQPVAAPSMSKEIIRTEPVVGTETGLVDEIGRSGVIETAVAYLIVAWILIQVVDVTFEQLAVEPLIGKFVIYFVIAGFPIALLLSWFINLAATRAAPGSRVRKKTFNSKYLPVLGGLIFASAGIFILDLYFGVMSSPAEVTSNETAPAVVTQSVPAPGIKPNTIAVLQFFNIDGSDKTEAFSNGLAEDVINSLAGVPGLRVSGRGDSFTMDPNSSSRDVRERLQVAYYIEGSVRMSDTSMRVVAQLIDTKDGFHIISRSFDREFADYFEIQDEITKLIIANLRVAIPSLSHSAPTITSSHTTFDAYLEYRQGMAILDQPLTAQTMALALDHFANSLIADPGYAAAYAGICLTYTGGYDATSNTQYIDDAERSCAEALALNPNLNAVRNALGDFYRRTGRYEDAERSFKQSLGSSATDVPALTGLGDVYSAQQRLDEAERLYQQAIGLQPGNWNTFSSLGRFMFTNGRYTEAAQAYQEVVNIDKRNVNGWTNLGTAEMLAGNFPAATQAFQEAISIDPIPTTYANLGLMHYYRGDFAQASDALSHAVEMAANDYLIWSNLGDVRFVSGDSKGAAQAFEKADSLATAQLEVNTRDADTIIDLAWIRAMLGKNKEAARLIERALDIAPGNPYVHYINALILVRMEKTEEALDKLENSVQMGYPKAFIGADPNFSSIEDDPRFIKLLER